MIKVRESLKEACQDCPLYEADLEVLEKRWIGQAVPDFDVTVICGRKNVICWKRNSQKTIRKRSAYATPPPHMTSTSAYLL